MIFYVNNQEVGRVTDNSFDKGDIGSSKLTLRSENFGLIQQPSIEAVTDMEVFLEVADDSITYDGSVTVRRSRFASRSATPPAPRESSLVRSCAS